MKKILLAVLVAALLGALAACAKAEPPAAGRPEPTTDATEAATEAPTEPEKPDPTTPEGAVAALFDSVKAWDTAAIEAHLPTGSSVSQAVPEQYQAALREVLDRVTYTCGDTAVNGDKATVAMEITSVDAESAVNDAIGAAAVYVAKQQLTGKPIESYDEVIGVVVDAIDIAALPAKTTTATAHLIRGGDGEWKLDLSDEANLPLLNAVSGGMVDLTDHLLALAETYGIQLVP